MLPELVEKFQSFIDNWTKGVQELVDEIFGEENENENEPILVSNTMYCETLIRTAAYEMLPNTWNKYVSMVYKSDVRVFNNTITVNTTPLGRLAFSKSEWQNLGGNAEACEAALNEQTISTYTIVKDYDEDVFIRYGTYDAYISLYYGTPPDYHDYDVYREIETDRGDIYKSDKCYVRFNNITYTIDNDGYVDVDTSYLDPYIDRMVAIKTHPVVMTCNDPTTITQYATDSGSTHNYHTTYTTTGGDTIDVYYGDSYIIVNNNGNDTSYDDLKNILDIAITQINDDNDTDIKVPTYRENKYGPEPPPPPPPTDDDDIDDQTIGAGANLASIARLWLLTRQQLIDLHAAFTSAPANYDPLTSFIGVLGFGVQPIKVVGDSLPWTLNPINIRMSSGETWHTGVEAHIVDSQVSAFSFPNIQIKKRYNNFLDYSPYATHEIFIPMCGWLTLPDIAVDRTISVTYLPDLESMKCRAIVSVVDEDGDRCVIGVKDGIMGAEVPFTNLNHSVWLANLITNSADVAGEVVTGAIGAGFTKTTAKGATYRPYEGFTIGMAGGLPSAVGNALLSGNVNRTHVVGSNGNRTGFSDGECIMVKSTYHKIDKPDNYEHTIGKVCNKTGQLSEFHGFTVCDNPHIHISALDEEKEEIKRLLEEGVILPDGE